MRILVLSALLICLSLVLIGGIGGEARIGRVTFYKAPFPLAQPDIATIAARAQGLNFWIRVQEGLNVAYLHGSELCTGCIPANEASFFGFPQLYLDDGLFLIRLDEADYRMVVRPATEALGAYEVIFGPKREMSPQAMEEEAQSWLQKLGIIQTTSLEFNELIPQEKPQPPAGAQLDSLLYALTIAPDWHDFARERGLSLLGLRIRVIVELVNPQVLPQGYYLLVEAQAQDLLRVLVPVSELIRLSHDPAVKLVRLPYEPHEAGGG
ncbi:MAG: hypothetical protein ACUVRH_02575 [Candidatus Bipolaricaulia bacterium]